MTKYHTAIFVNDWVGVEEEMYKFGDAFVRFEKIPQMLNLYYYELTIETSSLKEALFIIDLIICSFTLIYSEQTLLLEDLQNNMIKSVS